MKTMDMNWKSGNFLITAVLLLHLATTPHVSAQNFIATGSLGTARQLHTATLLNSGMVLIAGGLDSGGNVSASAELYNPATGTFSATGSLNTARRSHTATLLNSGMVLIAGGEGSSSALASAELYDPATGIFITTGSLSSAREIHTATLLNNGMVLIAAGFNFSVQLASAELYNPATGTFTPTGSLITARNSHTATLLNNGMVLIAGGVVNPGGVLGSAELYNPATGTFGVTGSLNTARYQHTSRLLNSGMVLIAGGLDSSFIVSASAELYNPATGTFTPTGSLITARSSHTATLLTNGQVLVAGGLGTSAALSSAELFGPINGNFTVFSDFGPGMTSAGSGGAGWCVSGNTTSGCGPLVDRWVASPFTPLGSFTLTQIDLALGYVSGNNAAGIELVNSQGGFPGTTVLESWSPLNLPPSLPNPPAPIVSLASNTPITLQGGTQYWVVTTGSASDTLDFWWGNTLGFAGSYESNNDGTSWYLLSNTPGTLTAFDVLGTSSPPFTTTGNMISARWDHTATLLNQGMALITGGCGNTSCPLASAELYQPELPPPTSQSMTQPLSPTAPNQFRFDNNTHNYVVQYPAGTSFSGVNMTVTAAQMSPASFQQRVVGTPFANALCIIYDGEAGYCEDYQVTCTNMSGSQITCPSESTPTIVVKSSFNTLRPITNPGFLTTPIGTNNWTNIFDSFYLQRIDPTMKGRTSGFSEFVAVDLGATNGQGAGNFQFLSPLQSNDQRIFPVGTSIPVEFQLTSLPRVPVTDAVASITVVMLSPTTSLVLEQPAAFTYSGGNYTYSLNTSGYAPGTYNITVYGNAFVAQQVEFTLTAATGPRISTTLQSLTLNGSTKQYAAVFKISNTGGTTAKNLAVTASKLDSTATVTSLPASLGNVNAGASVNVTLLFPETAGAPNSSGEITISESYAGGTSGGGFRVTLP